MDAIMVYLFGGFPLVLFIAWLIFAACHFVWRLFWGQKKDESDDPSYPKQVEPPIKQGVMPAIGPPLPVRGSGPINPLTGVPDPYFQSPTHFLKAA